MILDVDLRPGDRLPREPVLADQLGICRSSLREAVSALWALRADPLLQHVESVSGAGDVDAVVDNDIAFHHLIDVHRRRADPR